MQLRPLEFRDLPGWDPAELEAAWPAYLTSCRAIVSALPPLRSGVDPSQAMRTLAARALQTRSDREQIRRFFLESFRPVEVLSAEGDQQGFVTGYYEPELTGSETPDSEFSAPVLARPDDLIDMRGVERAGWDRKLEGARRSPSGQLEPYPTRAEIEDGVLGKTAPPILWLRDLVEVFFAQVQGSARVRLPNGERKRLVYAGRNGRPYTSIGKILIAQGEIPADQMSLARCKAWLRANGLRRGERARNVLQANESYVFFKLEDDTDPLVGPIGAQGLPLSSLRSIAVDRTIWPYGTPVWIGADLSSAGLGTAPSGRLMVAQDTGSAIVGAARGDLYIGSGDQAGDIAGLIRHSARFVVFQPVEPT